VYSGRVIADNSGSIYANAGHLATGALLVGDSYARLDNTGYVEAVALGDVLSPVAVGAAVYSFYGDIAPLQRRFRSPPRLPAT
jgi:hypothetical protein